jgi:hypothetical protein
MRGGAVAVGGADAVGAGVAAADDDDVLALGVDRVGAVAGDGLVLRDEEFQGEVHAGQLAAGNRQVARLFRAAGQHDGVEIGQLARRHGLRWRR